MFGFRIERSTPTWWMRILIPILVFVITFAVTAILIVLVGANPFEAYYYFLIDPLSSRVSAIEVLVKSTPLLLTGAAVTWAFTGGYYNIGAEGQLYAGAVAATAIGLQMNGVSPWLAIPLIVAGGFAAGMIWALTPALLKVKLAIDEVVTTLLLNSVMLFIVSALLNGPWRNPVSQWPQSPDIAAAAIFPRLLPRARLHFGFLLAIIVILAVWFIFRYTSLGVRMKAVGLAPLAARFAGINVGRTLLISALVSGGIAGLSGVSEIAGIHYHLIDAISPGYGYTGIIVATLGGLNVWGMAAAALFIGLIDTGAQTVSRALGVPVYLGDIIQATLLLVTLALLPLQGYRIRRR
ncbi:MAG: ABC transporter permease [Caldilinea sp.]|nr:ABC transporter permease [Caldilineaceae bacterium]MCB9119786.1 ABC transporter permease [Caldilineaceae bacterium]MCO5211420.1 ABC transporter permease [Caldilinea sp.]